MWNESINGGNARNLETSREKTCSKDFRKSLVIINQATECTVLRQFTKIVENHEQIKVAIHRPGNYADDLLTYKSR